MQFIQYLSLLALMLSCPLHAAFWHTDYAEAQSLSSKSEKPLLLFFNGSDWSGWAMKMKHEILDLPQFQEKIERELVCVDIDFPKHQALPEKIRQQNLTLKKNYDVSETPSLLLVDVDGRLIAKVGYIPESIETLSEDLLRFLKQDKELQRGIQTLEASLSSTEKAVDESCNIRRLYALAQELRQPPALERVIALGLKTQDPYFYTEKYRLLLEQGGFNSAAALKIREELSTLDPINAQGTHFTLALIDYQELSQRGSPQKAIEPIKNYLERFGSQDLENAWRLELMLAEAYLESQEYGLALEYAQKAYDSAPESRWNEVAQSVEYIKAHSARKI